MRRVLALLLLTSCSWLTDLSDLGADADGATASDGGSDLDSGSLLLNAGFEQANTTYCGPGWTVLNATMKGSPTAHGGAQSCRVCVLAPGKAAWFTASPPPVKNPPVGSRYFAEAWVEIEPDASFSQVSLLIEEGNAKGSSYLGQQPADVQSLAWQDLQAPTGATNDAGTSVSFNVLLTPTDGGSGCVLVDDTTFFQQF